MFRVQRDKAQCLKMAPQISEEPLARTTAYGASALGNTGQVMILRSFEKLAFRDLSHCVDDALRPLS